MTATICKHCGRGCAGPQGLASHLRSMHPETLPGWIAPKSELVWEDPPARGRPLLADEVRSDVEELRRNPGRWAKVRTYPAPSSAAACRPCLIAAYPDIEWRASRTADGGSAIYGRAPTDKQDESS